MGRVGAGRPGLICVSSDPTPSRRGGSTPRRHLMHSKPSCSRTFCYPRDPLRILRERCGSEHSLRKNLLFFRRNLYIVTGSVGSYPKSRSRRKFFSAQPNLQRSIGLARLFQRWATNQSFGSWSAGTIVNEFITSGGIRRGTKGFKPTNAQFVSAAASRRCDC